MSLHHRLFLILGLSAWLIGAFVVALIVGRLIRTTGGDDQ